MRIFELHFNPKLSEDHFFESFSYSPQTGIEKKLGSLHQVGEIRNGLPQNAKLLHSLSRAIKENYYGFSSKSQEKASIEALKKANSFLEQELKKDNVSWLGNLSYAVLSFKESDLFFTKTGDIKILMLRQGQFTDIAKDLKLEKIEPYPLKVFFNIVSGKTIENDAILILTKGIYDYLNQKKILDKLAKAGPLDEKKIKEIFPESLFLAKEEKKAPKVSGVCFIAVASREFKKESKKTKDVFENKKEKFDFKEVFAPAILALKRFMPKKKKKIVGKKKKGNILEDYGLKRISKKAKIILISSLAVLIFLGVFALRKGGDNSNSALASIEEKVKEAQKELVYRREEQAKAIFQQALEEIQALPKNKKTNSLRGEIEESLLALNRVEKWDDIQAFYQLSEFSADGLSLADNDLFFYSQGKEEIYKVSLDSKKLEILNSQEKVYSAGSDSGLFFAFSKPDTIIRYKGESLEKEQISFPSSILLMAPYYKGVYFLDKDCKVLKVSFSDQGFSLPSQWLKEPLKQNCSNVKSIAIDSSLWALNKDNSIDVFYKGAFEKTIKIGVFPRVEELDKIIVKIDAPYAYLLDKQGKRIIVYDKEGKYVKQIISSKFESLQDFSVSEDGKDIYILSGNKVFRIKM